MIHSAAVLTGDLINSTDAGQIAIDAAMGAIEAVALNEGRISKQDIRFERFRGDGWQIYSSNPTRAFRLTVLILASLRCRPPLPRTRISVAVGPISALPTQGLASASGEAFTVSGRELDSMPGREHLTFRSHGPGAAWKTAFFTYLKWQSDRWSPEQAEAIALTFRTDPPQPKKLHEELGISRQAFGARLDGAGYEPVWEAEQAFRVEPEGRP